jgi:hypothetical protein
LLDLCVSL